MIVCAGHRLGATARDLQTVGDLEVQGGQPLRSWMQGEENRGSP